MGFALLKKKAHSLLDEAEWIARIKNKNEYGKALSLMDELIEDYDDNILLIEVLSSSIERWENENEEFFEFNESIAQMDSAISLLRLIMDQHDLGVSDLPEIGTKSLVSKILNGKRRLTLDHITALSKRFSVNPGLFFSIKDEPIKKSGLRIVKD